MQRKQQQPHHRRFLPATTLAIIFMVLLAACGGPAPEAPVVAPAATAPAAAETAATDTEPATAAETAATEPEPAAAAETAATDTEPATAAETAASEATTVSEATEPAATAASSAPAAMPSSFQEAPQFAEQVSAGTLPAVVERLPKTPLVVTPFERVGTYGGDWRTALVGGGDESYLVRTIDYDNLVRWTPAWDDVIPNIAESFEANEDATEFTFKLREGMKWSDGKPYTADDIMFWYEDIFMNDELTPERGGYLVVNKEPVVVEKVDQYTVKFKFAGSHGLFLRNLASADANHPARFPKHYLQQFHKKYNPDGVDALAKEAGQEDWIGLFGVKSVNYTNAEIPVLTAWKLTGSLGESTTRLVAERNPYYWKVDTEGNQLPYLDRVVFDQIAAPEVLVLKALGGEIDMMDRHLNVPANKPVFVDGQEQGDFQLFETTPSTANHMVIQFNLTHPDENKRKVFQDKNFRIGMSHAINRPEIIDLVYVGQTVPYQAAPRPESEFYNERLAKQFTEYDVDLANEYLDKVLPEKDAEGFRLGPDGKRFTFVLEIDGARTTFVDELAQVIPDWEAVGIQASVKPEDRSLWETRVRDGTDFDATAHRFGGGSGQAVVLDPRYWFPASNNSMYAKRWAAWFNNPEGELAEEPPAATKKQMELYNQLKSTADPAEQAGLMKQILEIAADEFYTIGSSLEINNFGIVKNGLENVPLKLIDSFIYPVPAPVNPETWFWDKTAP